MEETFAMREVLADEAHLGTEFLTLLSSQILHWICSRHGAPLQHMHVRMPQDVLEKRNSIRVGYDDQVELSSSLDLKPFAERQIILPEHARDTTFSEFRQRRGADEPIRAVHQDHVHASSTNGRKELTFEDRPADPTKLPRRAAQDSVDGIGVGVVDSKELDSMAQSAQFRGQPMQILSPAAFEVANEQKTQGLR